LSSLCKYAKKQDVPLETTKDGYSIQKMVKCYFYRPLFPVLICIYQQRMFVQNLNRVMHGEVD
jgi:hypothetical protein